MSLHKWLSCVNCLSATKHHMPAINHEGEDKIEMAEIDIVAVDAKKCKKASHKSVSKKSNLKVSRWFVGLKQRLKKKKANKKYQRVCEESVEYKPEPKRCNETLQNIADVSNFQEERGDMCCDNLSTDHCNIEHCAIIHTECRDMPVTRQVNSTDEPLLCLGTEKPEVKSAKSKATVNMREERQGHHSYTYEHRSALWEAACTSEQAFQEQINKLKNEFGPRCIQTWRSEQTNMTMLHLAAEYGYNNSLKTLVTSRFANYKYLKTATRYKGETALTLASRNGNSKSLKLLLEYISKADAKYIVDIPNHKGYTALMLAISGHHEDTANLLLDVGCQTAVKTDGQTALTLAAKEGMCNIVKKILSGLNSQITDDVFVSLKCALDSQHEDVVFLLLDYVGWHNSKLVSDEYSIFLLAIKSGCVNVVVRLFKLGSCDIYQHVSENIKSDPVKKLDMQPVHLAAFKGHIEIVDKLVEQGADIKALASSFDGVDDAPLSVIDVAILGKQENMVQYLVEHRQCEINTHTDHYKGHTALTLAIEMQMEPLAQWLLQHGSDPDKVIETFKGKPCKLQAIHMAAFQGYEDLVFALFESTSIAATDSLFWENYRKVSLLHIAVVNGFTKFVEKLLTKDVVLINAQMSNGHTALTLAVDGGHLSIVNILLQDAYCDTSKSVTVYDNKSNLRLQAVHIAALKGHKYILQQLLEPEEANSRAIAKWLGQDGWTILHLATLNRHVECVQYIVNVTNCDIEAELDVAARSRTQRPFTAGILAKSGADISEKGRHQYREIAKIIEGKIGSVKDDLPRLDLQTASQGTVAHSRQSSLDSLEEYNLGTRPLGVAVMITNRHSETHSGMTDRPGTETDRDRLRSVFIDLGLLVHEVNDLTATAMFDCMKFYSQQDYSLFGCFISCIMSHGRQNDIAGVDGARLPVVEISKLFVSCETLKDKPKLFIFVACKGSREIQAQSRATSSTQPTAQSAVSSAVMSSAATSSTALSSSNLTATGDAVAEIQCDAWKSLGEQPVKLDMRDLLPELDTEYLIVYSTLPGNVSYRLPEGSPFVKHFARNLKKCSLKKKDINDVFTHTINNLKKEVVVGNYKQTSMYCTSLSKDFILKPSGIGIRDISLPKFNVDIALRLEGLRFEDAPEDAEL